MNKTSLAGTSLVAALPAGFLGYLMLMAVINSMDVMPTIMKVSAILLLVIAAAVMLLPVYIMIYYGGKTEKVAKTNAKTEAVPAAHVADEDVSGDFEAVDDESEASFDSDDSESMDEGFDDFDDNSEFDADDDEFEFDDEEDS